MRNAGSTTVIEITSLLLLASALGTISGHFTASALIVSTSYLGLTLWRRNSLYRWLEGYKKNDVLLSSDLWRDVVRRIELDREDTKQKRDKLSEQLHNLRHALSSLNIGMVLTDDTWALTWWNTHGGELLGLRHPDDVDGYLFALLRSPALKSYISSQQFDDPLIVDNFRNDNQSIEFFFGPVPSSGYIILVRDVTRFQKLNKMRSDFIANVSHELKTPLTVINGYLETLIDNGLVDHVASKAISNAWSQSQRMSTIIQDLMTLSQLETSQSPDQTTFNLNGLLDQVAQQARLHPAFPAEPAAHERHRRAGGAGVARRAHQEGRQHCDDRRPPGARGRKRRALRLGLGPLVRLHAWAVPATRTVPVDAGVERAAGRGRAARAPHGGH